MIQATQDIINMLHAPLRRIVAKVEFFNGSTLANSFSGSDSLIDFSVERTGESKFFGFGICQKLKVNLLDLNRQINPNEENSFKIAYGMGDTFIYPSPTFYFAEASRDENTNNLAITAYDALYAASAHKVEELNLQPPYTIAQIAEACGSLLGLSLKHDDDESWGLSYPDGANFEGTETIRECLNAIAEATQTIYYIDSEQNLYFKRLGLSTALELISKENYVELKSEPVCILSDIVHATELGDNLIASTGLDGKTQYVRDNPLWELRDDIATLVEKAVAAIGGLSINQFTCSWKGNFLVEIGDKLVIQTKDNGTITTYLLNDTITYNGGLKQESQWSCTDNSNESSANPTSLGEVIKQTYAKVDKANKQIDIVASETSGNSKAISAIQVNLEGINASVTKTEETINGVNNRVDVLNSKVEAAITADEVRIEVQKELVNGVDKVVTNTGYSLNDEGLTVSKSSSEMSTTISEDGMQVFKEDEAVLTANNHGVDAANLHATTFLIIGGRSRFENYGSDRTACFWIGG